MDPATKAKIYFITFTPCALAPISLLGSSLTLLTIYRAWSVGTKLKTYHRLLIGISIYDIILSTALAFGPLPVPGEVMWFLGEPWPGSHGNTASCTSQAFFLTLGIAGVPYSCMLMLYYVMVIRLNMRESAIERLEPWMHLIPTFMYTTIAIVGLATQVFNSQSSLCWVATYPLGCTEIPDMECTRGEHAMAFNKYLMTIPLLIWTLLLVIALLIIAATAFYRYQRSRRFVFRGSAGNRQAEKQLKQIVIQCNLYGVTFVNMMLWANMETVLLLAGVEYDTSGREFYLHALTTIFFPIQGFFNFCIYIRPRYLLKRDTYPSQGRFFALCEAIWNPITTTTTTTTARKAPTRSSSLFGFTGVIFRTSLGWSSRGESSRAGETATDNNTAAADTTVPRVTNKSTASTILNLENEDEIPKIIRLKESIFDPDPSVEIARENVPPLLEHNDNNNLQPRDGHDNEEEEIFRA